jgi:hypothetical protein
MAFDQTAQNRDNDFWTEEQPQGIQDSGPSPYDTVAGYYQNYLGRAGSSSEINNWLQGTQGNLEAAKAGIMGSDEFKKRQPTSLVAPQAQTGDANRQRILDALKNVNSTDDPNYWMDKVSGDPNGFGSAWGYWQDRINRGDGSNLIANGTLQKFQDGGSQSSSSFGTGPFQDFSKYFQPNAIHGGILGDSGAFGDQLVNQLTQRANQSLNIDPKTDPIIKRQVDAASATQERGRRNYLNDLAESSNPYATGSMNTAATQTAEAAAQNTSAMESQLTQNELTARRQEIEQALQSEGNLLTTDQYLSLQRELNAVNAGLQQQGISNNFTLGQGGLDLQRLLGLGGLNLQQQGLNSQNDQFAANYNLNATDRAKYWDMVYRNGGK